MIRSYSLEHSANEVKQEEIRSFLPVWNATLTLIKQAKIKSLKNGEGIKRYTASQWVNLDCKVMSRRQLKSAENQVNDAMKAWVKQAQSVARKQITMFKKSGEYSDEKAHEQYCLNLQLAWWSKNADPRIIQNVLKQCPYPVFSQNRTMRFDEMVADHHTANHERWINLRLFKGKNVSIPLFETSYYKAKASEGIEKHVTLVTVKETGEIAFSRPIEYSDAEPRTQGETLGLDWGLKHLITLSNGEHYGSHLYSWLTHVDSQLTQLVKDLQARRIPLKSSKRYRRFQHRIREHFKNIIGAFFNKLGRSQTQAIVREALDFRGKFLSPKLRRLLSRFGRNVFSQRARELPEKHGISVVEVNPAYSSRECGKCSSIDKSNRVGERFCCRVCGFTAHADVNASVNILRRSGDSAFAPGKSMASVESVLLARHEVWLVSRGLRV